MARMWKRSLKFMTFDAMEYFKKPFIHSCNNVENVFITSMLTKHAS